MGVLFLGCEIQMREVMRDLLSALAISHEIEQRIALIVCLLWDIFAKIWSGSKFSSRICHLTIIDGSEHSGTVSTASKNSAQSSLSSILSMSSSNRHRTSHGLSSLLSIN